MLNSDIDFVIFQLVYLPWQDNIWLKVLNLSLYSTVILTCFISACPLALARQYLAKDSEPFFVLNSDSDFVIFQLSHLPWQDNILLKTLNLSLYSTVILPLSFSWSTALARQYLSKDYEPSLSSTMILTLLYFSWFAALARQYLA